MSRYPTGFPRGLGPGWELLSPSQLICCNSLPNDWARARYPNDWAYHQLQSQIWKWSQNDPHPPESWTTDCDISKRSERTGFSVFELLCCVSVFSEEMVQVWTLNTLSGERTVFPSMVYHLLSFTEVKTESFLFQISSFFCLGPVGNNFLHSLQSFLNRQSQL